MIIDFICLMKFYPKLILMYVLISSSIYVGIEYLYENHLLKHDPQDVAQFLYKGEGLNKTAIGNLLLASIS